MQGDERDGIKSGRTRSPPHNPMWWHQRPGEEVGGRRAEEAEHGKITTRSVASERQEADLSEWRRGGPAGGGRVHARPGGGRGARERKLEAQRAGCGGDAAREVGFEQRARPCACAGWRKANVPGRERKGQCQRRKLRRFQENVKDG